MIEDHRSVHLVHGPGNDGMLLCLQIVKRALLSGSSVFWLEVFRQLQRGPYSDLWMRDVSLGS